MQARITRMPKRWYVDVFEADLHGSYYCRIERATGHGLVLVADGWGHEPSWALSNAREQLRRARNVALMHHDAADASLARYF